MKQVFQKTWEVHSFDILNNQQLNPVRLVDYLNDTAAHHSESLGYSMETLFHKGYSWILLSWNISINRWPRLREIINIETWISQLKRCFAYREFIIKDRQNKHIIKASSRWIFYDINRHKPIKIPVELSHLWLIKKVEACSPSIIDADLFQQSDGPNKEQHYFIQEQDIDVLGHVHNSRYIDWILLRKPKIIKEKYSLKHLQVFYHHEIKYPGEIIVHQKIFPQKNKLEYLIYDQIWDNRNKQRVATIVVTQWTLDT